MPPTFEVPSDKLPLAGQTAQKLFRDALHENDKQFTVVYDDENYIVPASRSEAKTLLLLDNVDDPAARRVREAISSFARRSEPIVAKWSNSVGERVAETIKKRNGSEWSPMREIIEREALELVSSIFGFACRSAFTNMHEAFLADDHERLKGFSEIIAATPNGLMKELCDLPAQYRIMAVQMTYGVTINPMSNFCALGLFLMKHRKSDTSEPTIAGVFRTLCSDLSPTYPGLFRRDGRGIDFLVPATWPDAAENFTFGWGPRSCPGRSVVYRFFMGLLEALDMLDGENLKFIPRPAVPFGILDVRWVNKNV